MHISWLNPNQHEFIKSSLKSRCCQHVTRCVFWSANLNLVERIIKHQCWIKICGNHRIVSNCLKITDSLSSWYCHSYWVQNEIYWAKYIYIIILSLKLPGTTAFNNMGRWELSLSNHESDKILFLLFVFLQPKRSSLVFNTLCILWWLLPLWSDRTLCIYTLDIVVLKMSHYNAE